MMKFCEIHKKEKSHLGVSLVGFKIGPFKIPVIQQKAIRFTSEIITN